MNKKELVEAIKENIRGEIYKFQIEEMLNGFVKAVTNAVKKDKKVTLTGFGTFSLIKRKATTKKNPQTGATVKVPAKNAMKFKTSKALNEGLN